jgi:hypothetical protein
MTATIPLLCRRLHAPALLLLLAGSAQAQAIDVTKKLEGFDVYMAKTLKDWNAPGVGVGIVVNDKLVLEVLQAQKSERAGWLASAIRQRG